MTHLSANPPTDSVSVRRYLCDALRIDLVGPRPEDAALQHERLPQAPSRWYLTGFLAPGDAPEEQLAQDDEEALDEPAEPLHGGDDAGTPDRGSHKRLFLPSSMGLSLLVDEETQRLDVAVSWGDYAPEIVDAPEIADTPGVAGTPGVADAPDAAGSPASGGARDVPGESVAPAAREDGESFDATAAPDVASGARDAPGESIAPAAREDGSPPDATAAANVASGVQDAPDKPGASAAREGDGPPEDENLPEGENPSESSRRTRRFAPWVRRPGSGAVAIDLAAVAPGRPTRFELPGSGGLAVVCLVRPTRVQALGGSRAARAVSLFTVNRRPPAPDGDGQDAAFAFQVEMHVEADRPLIPRVNLNGLDSADWDERLADLHYRDVAEYAVGHNVSTRADLDGGDCRRVRTEWMPQAGVPRVEPSAIGTVEFGMEALGGLDGAPAAKVCLEPLVEQYRDWIAAQRQDAAGFTGRRREVAEELVRRAGRVADRIQTGIALLGEADVLEAFRIANRAMAAAARRRRALEEGKRPEDVAAPAWRPFQLAYILMNLRGIAEPTHPERDVVDLLFFPTGGGKTEAYLGLAAFTLVLRRLRHPGSAGRGPAGHGPDGREPHGRSPDGRSPDGRGPCGPGLSVLMRYTLRLLTLDQLGRAAALICALELEREQAPERLGEWPFEIALWVGRAATPNYMGRQGEAGGTSARVKTLRYARDSSREPPLPLEQCPWCGTPFERQSFRLHPNTNEPTDLFVHCVNRHCDFSRKRPLPIVAVDEPIYRRLPAFMIATADKFAALPWTGETARFFHGGDPDHPRPPDLIIQDELHLISGPLGTMAGLYETAIDRLCTRRIGGGTVRPKVIASTATVRLAQKQIQALFNRREVEVFPAPGPDRRDSFFARQVSESAEDERLYLGVAAQGRGPKVVFLRSMITLMAAAQAAWEAAGGAGSGFAAGTETVAGSRIGARSVARSGVAAKSGFAAGAESRTGARSATSAAARSRAGAATRSGSRARAAAGLGFGAASNPADPYMTAVAYFNALRELGSARRIVEDEIGARLLSCSERRRLDEATGLFADRQIAFEPVELTSRVGTADVADAKRRLALDFTEDQSVDVALATNMISVGLDITRLGLMLVSGQPKTTSEYIQATSRVGRDPARPGLVVALLNVHKPRDRSHYERFPAFHESFYRNVEATSVTPFSSRALDRGLPAVTVALARLGVTALTPTPAARDVEAHRAATDAIAGAVGDRAQHHADDLPADAGRAVQRRVQSLIRRLGGAGPRSGGGRRDVRIRPRAERARLHPAPARDDRPRSGHAHRPAATLPRAALATGRRAGRAARHQDARRPGRQPVSCFRPPIREILSRVTKNSSPTGF